MKIINPVNNFSGNRFLHVLKCGFLSPEFRLCVMSMAVMYMIFFFVKLFGSAPVYEMMDELSDFTFLTMVFGITFGASFFAASLSDKGNRISHIMLPATNMEKFLARLIIVVCGTIVASYIIYLVLYLLLGIILWISGDIPADAKFNPFAYFNFRFYGVTRINEFLLPLFVFVCALFGFSLYLLGGILWKKKSWIITSIILIPYYILGVTAEYLTAFKNINIWGRNGRSDFSYSNNCGNGGILFLVFIFSFQTHAGCTPRTEELPKRTAEKIMNFISFSNRQVGLKNI